MDKLNTLQSHVSFEANGQAEDIYRLMQEAILLKKDSITFSITPPKKLHPLVIHILTSKGYIIDDITHKSGYSLTTTYNIHI